MSISLLKYFNLCLIAVVRSALENAGTLWPQLGAFAKTKTGQSLQDRAFTKQ